MQFAWNIDCYAEALGEVARFAISAGPKVFVSFLGGIAGAQGAAAWQRYRWKATYTAEVRGPASELRTLLAKHELSIPPTHFLPTDMASMLAVLASVDELLTGTQQLRDALQQVPPEVRGPHVQRLASEVLSSLPKFRATLAPSRPWDPRTSVAERDALTKAHRDVLTGLRQLLNSLSL